MFSEKEVKPRMKLLIVEDEAITREGLRDCVDWGKYDIQIAGEARNGREAIRFLSECPVDIVLTDVVMPIMDGIELIKQIRTLDMDIKVIFISGHGDINYLKSALQFDAIDYILKPIVIEELEKVICKVIGLHKREQESKNTLAELRTKLAESMPIARERFISKLVSGKITSEEYIHQRLQFLDLPFGLRDCYHVVCAAFDLSQPDLSGFINEEDEIDRLAVNEVIYKHFREHFRIFSYFVDNGELVVLLAKDRPTDYKEILSLTEEVLADINQNIGVRVTLAIGKEVDNIMQVHVSYLQSMRALEQKHFLGNNQVIHSNDIETVVSKNTYEPMHDRDQIVEAVRLGKHKDVERHVDVLFERLRQSGNISLEYIQNICLVIVVEVNKQMIELRASQHSGEESMFLWEKLFQKRTLLLIQEWMKETLSGAAKRVAEVRNNTSRSIIDIIKREVCLRLNENLTIHEFAEKLSLTPNYLYMLFKNETGETYNDYYTRVSIDKAKELLKDPVLKIYEIADRVGYRGVDYFTRVFKKNVGVTPSEFRKTIIL